MKKIILLLFTLTLCLQLNAQDNNYVEKSIGLSYTASTISKGYDSGYGLVVSIDYDSSGLGFGLISQVTYLNPAKEISDYIDYGLTYDFLVKYDFEVLNGFEVAPTVGFGYFGVQSDDSSNKEYYFAAGATASYFISNAIVLGLDITKPFLEGAKTSAAISIRFQI